MRIFGFIAFFSIFLVIGCSGNNNEWHQKLTVTVEIDGQTYVGSGVSKMRAKSAGRVAYESRGVAVDEDFEGEAVVINLGQYGYLFALWKYQDPGYWARSMRGGPKYRGDYDQAEKQRQEYYNSVSSSKRAMLLTPGKIPDYETNYPLFVAFKDINDPKTIQTFAKKFHWEKQDRTARVFDERAFSHFYGGRARVTSVTFEITDEPVTKDLLHSVLTKEYFDNWHEIRKENGLGIDCDRKLGSEFCGLTYGKWVRKFPGTGK